VPTRGKNHKHFKAYIYYTHYQAEVLSDDGAVQNGDVIKEL